MSGQKFVLAFLLTLVCVLGCLKLLAGPKVYASSRAQAHQQELVVEAQDVDAQDDDSGDSSFDVSDYEDFAIVPYALGLVLNPPEKVFVSMSVLPTNFTRSVELPPPKV